jgi:ribosomal protein S12 methylthiotransferase
MKIGLLSLGCPKNLVDSEVMLGLAHQAGHRVTTDPHDAEVLIVNTCAFIDRAKQESIDAVLEMAEHKKTGACRRLVVTGCLAERYRDELRAQIPEIDVTLGTGEVPQIVDAIGRADLRSFASPTEAEALGRSVIPLKLVGAEAGSPTPGARVLPTYLYDADTPRRLATEKHLAYIKIAEGCDYKCSFCIIPTLRGHYRSRVSASIVAEARTLAAAGVREIILISQDTTFYGIDRNERGALARLLRELNRIDGLEWIRLLYLYPTTITDDTLDAMAECDKVCKYVDLPLQHASDRMLKAMKRPGTRRSYERLLTRVRSKVRDVALRTTFIVGFPGETESDFNELYDFVGDTAFDHMGVFTYSHEEGTRAFALSDDVPRHEKRRRRDWLMALQKGIVQRAQRARVGRQVRVLVDGPAPDHELVLRGRLQSQAPEIDATVYLTECDPARLPSGTFANATIVGAREYDLIARPAPM